MLFLISLSFSALQSLWAWDSGKINTTISDKLQALIKLYNTLLNRTSSIVSSDCLKHIADLCLLEGQTK